MRAERVRPCEYVGRVGTGGSQPQVVRCSDGRVYAVKFGDNPGPTFGLRVLPAELVASRIARLLGVRTPEYIVLAVGQEFLAENPDLRLMLPDGNTRQPSAGLCLGSPWVDGGKPAPLEGVPLSEDNADVLASTFVADNVMCMNHDHCRPYGNLVLDSDGRVWVVDWGHPFFFSQGGKAICNDWSERMLCRFVSWDVMADGELLPLPPVRDLLRGKTAAARGRLARELDGAFEGIPDEWGVSGGEKRCARWFVQTRAELLPDLVERWLAS